MHIDWFTTLAQIINFLILIWLLKKMLYQPVLNTIQQRDQAVADRLQQAEQTMQEAEQLKNEYQKQLDTLHQRQSSILQQTQQQAGEEKAEQLKRLAEEMDLKKQQFDKNMLAEQQAQQKLVRQVVTEQVLQTSGKILADLSGQTLERQMIERFLQQLKSLPTSELETLKTALSNPSGAEIYTRFAIDEDMKKRITDQVKALAPETIVHFKQQDLLCGIKLEAAGRSWDWHIDRYLKDLTTALRLSSSS